jgi:omega-amidase
MKISLVQSSPKLNRSNLEDVLKVIGEHKDSDVVVFPELALSGYMLQDKLYEDAWTLEELESIAALSLDCDIVVGAALWDKATVYNSALYFSQGKLLWCHHKNHLPTYGMFEEGRYFTAGNEIESFDTAYGRACMVVCEDVWRASTFADIAKHNCDIVYVLAASPARNFSDEGLEIEQQWDVLLKSLALLTKAYVVFVNRVGFEDGLGFWGSSRVITPTGYAEHTLPLFDITVSEVSLNHKLQKLERYIAKNS